MIPSGVVAVLGSGGGGSTPPPSAPPTLWVNGVFGNDAATIAAVRAGGGAVAWQTIGRAAWGSTNFLSPNAAEAAAAGDVVLIAAGTYSTPAVSTYVAPSARRYTPVYKCVNSGTSANPIEFRANGTVTLQTTGGSGVVIGGLNQGYIKWVGVTIDEANAPSAMDTGPATFFGCDGGIIDQCTLIGDPTYFPGDNHCGVRIEDCQNITVSRTTISYFRNTGSPAYGGTHTQPPHNANGIETYTSGNLLFYQNTIHHCGAGIFLKANNDTGFGPIRVYQNYLHDNEWSGVHFYRRASDSSLYYAYQNLLVNNQYNCVWANFSDATNPKHTRVFNNTIVGGSYSFYIGGLDAAGDHIVKNNICSGPSISFIWAEGVEVSEMADTARMILDRNLFFGASVRFARVEGVSGVNYAALADWRAAVNQDPNSSVTDPLFVGSGNYHLRGGSPALTLGRVVDGIGGTTGATIPAGCYITGSETIGVS